MDDTPGAHDPTELYASVELQIRRAVENTVARGGDRDEAESDAQDAFLYALRTYRPDRGSFRTYFTKILDLRMLDQFRPARRRARERLVPATDVLPDDEPSCYEPQGGSQGGSGAAPVRTDLSSANSANAYEPC